MIFSNLIAQFLPILSEKMTSIFNQIEYISDYINEYSTIDKNNSEQFDKDTYLMTANIEESFQVNEGSNAEVKVFAPSIVNTSAEPEAGHMGDYIRVLKASYNVTVESQARFLSFKIQKIYQQDISFKNEETVSLKDVNVNGNLNVKVMNQSNFEKNLNLNQKEKVIKLETLLQEIGIELTAVQKQKVMKGGILSEALSMLSPEQKAFVSNTLIDQNAVINLELNNKVGINESTPQKGPLEFVDTKQLLTYLINMKDPMTAAAKSKVTSSLLSVEPSLIPLAAEADRAHLENYTINNLSSIGKMQNTMADLLLQTPSAILEDQKLSAMLPLLISTVLQDLKMPTIKNNTIEPFDGFDDLLMQEKKQVVKAETLQEKTAELLTEEVKPGALVSFDLSMPVNIAKAQQSQPSLESKLLSVFDNDKLGWNKLVHAASAGKLNDQAKNIIEKIHTDDLIDKLKAMPDSSPSKDDSASNLSQLLFNKNLFDKDLRQQTISELLNEPNWLKIGQQAFDLNEDELDEAEKDIFEELLKIKFDEQGINEYMEEFMDTIQEIDITKVDDTLAFLSSLSGVGSKPETVQSLADMPLVNKLYYIEFIKDFAPRRFESVAIEEKGESDVEGFKQIKDMIDLLDKRMEANEENNTTTDTTDSLNSSLNHNDLLDMADEILAKYAITDDSLNDNAMTSSLKSLSLENLSYQSLMDRIDNVMEKYGFSTEGELKTPSDDDTIDFKDVLALDSDLLDKLDASINSQRTQQGTSEIELSTTTADPHSWINHTATAPSVDPVINIHQSMDVSVM
ncbi:MAG: hypothetical protein JSS07_09125 [Proteobacteria bacterium]|nr:hypothetical protein [Pseudomonadota bacterium]